MFGILSIGTAVTAFFLKNYEENDIYDFPLFYKYQYAWYNAADY